MQHQLSCLSENITGLLLLQPFDHAADELVESLSEQAGIPAAVHTQLWLYSIPA